MTIPPLDPDGSASTEVPPPLVEDVPEMLTPMGEVHALGAFARGLGARRMRLVITVVGGLALLLALLIALS